MNILSVKQQLAIKVAGFSVIFLSQGAISIYLPSFLTLQSDFSTTKDWIDFSLTFYLLSFATFMFLGSELSEVLGRKKVLCLGLLLFGFATVAVTLSNSISIFILFRILEGAGAGLATNAIRASAGGFFVGSALAKVSSYFSMAVALAAGMPQFLGGLMEKYFSWRGDFYVMLGVAMLTLIYVLYQFPETKKIVPQQRTVSGTVKDYWVILLSPQFIFPTLLSGFIYGIVICFNVMSPNLFQSLLHFTPEMYGALSLFITVGYLLGAILANRLVTYFGIPAMLSIGLRIILIASLAMLLFSYLGFFNAYIVCIPMFFAIAGQAIILPNSLALTFHNSKGKSGNIAALYGSTMLIISGLLTFLVSLLPNQNIQTLALVVLTIGIVAVFIRRKINSTIIQ